MPWLRECPVTAANPAYPPCQVPAERPIFTNENCHACTRVLWNMEVLRKEEEHRQMHKQGTCHCEVMFDEEERQRRQRPRSKGKAKGKDNVEAARIEHSGHGGNGQAAGRVDGGSGMGNEVGPESVTSGMSDAGLANPRQNWASDAQMAAYQYVGYNGAAPMGLGTRLRQYEQAGGIPGGQVKMALAPRAQGPPHGSNMGGIAGGRMLMDQIAAGQGFPDGGGYVPREFLWEGQTQIGEQGAGMKWYPHQHADNIPPVPELYSSPARAPPATPEQASSHHLATSPPSSTRPITPHGPVFDSEAALFARVFDKKPLGRQQARSEPAADKTTPTITRAGPVSSTQTKQQQPEVVSSDMSS